MAKARRQTHMALVDESGQQVRPGDELVLSGQKFRLEKVVGGSSTLDVTKVKVQPLGSSLINLSDFGLAEREVEEGCSLHLMEEEARAVLAAMSLLVGMRRATPESQRRPAYGLDGSHDLEYWLDRVKKALSAAGYGATTDRTYWELARLIDDYRNRQR